MNEEGKKEIERLRKEYVIDENHLNIYNKQRLLSKFYELKDENIFNDYLSETEIKAIDKIIKSLETDLQIQQDLL